MSCSQWPTLFKLVIRDVTCDQVTPELLRDKDQKTQSGSNVLHFAATNIDNDNLVFFIIEKAKCQLQQQNNYGEYPLHWACKHASIGVIRHMILYGAPINIYDSMGNSPLHWAAEYDRPEIISFLLSLGASLSAVNSDQQTPYDIALDSGLSYPILQILHVKQRKVAAFPADALSPF